MHIAYHRAVALARTERKLSGNYSRGSCTKRILTPRGICLAIHRSLGYNKTGVAQEELFRPRKEDEPNAGEKAAGWHRRF